jgi:hypothetical protein
MIFVLVRYQSFLQFELVIPVQTGIQFTFNPLRFMLIQNRSINFLYFFWIPAFAGMTGEIWSDIKHLFGFLDCHSRVGGNPVIIILLIFLDTDSSNLDLSVQLTLTSRPVSIS